MSVFIKGMEMPKSCDTCFLSKWDTCNERFYCMFDDCPLVEVPAPHGRIADMDEAIKCIEEVKGKDAELAISLIEWACGKRTIIEAEGRNDRQIT